MPVRVLGISAFYHDSAATLASDGEIVAAAQEERFSRKKHDARFPKHAVNYCLEEGFLDPAELDAIVFYDNPYLTFDRVLKNILELAPASGPQWRKAAPSLLGVKTLVGKYIREALGTDVKTLFTEHHMSHAASAFYPSPFEEAAILTTDGVGEWATTTIGAGHGNRIELIKEIRYPHSLGLLYSAMTQFCGFKVNSGEYKLMGLAPYGRPIHADTIRQHLIDLKPDGSFRLRTERFAYLRDTVMTDAGFEELFGGPARQPESRITRREMDLAASVQQVLEEAVFALARHARDLTGLRHLVLAGGVALNCVANGHLLRSGTFDDLWIQPAAGDAGGSLGAALLASHVYFDVPRRRNPTGRDSQRGSYLGPRFPSDEVQAFLSRRALPHERVSEAELPQRVAQALAEGQVVGFLNGRMEFGPRALGARSILGDPRRLEMQSVMNLKIKFRESFRPFAPAVLASRVGDYFELDRESPYMLLVAPVRRDRRTETPVAGPGPDDDMLGVVHQQRSDIPAVTHVDYSARIQTVHRDDHPVFHDTIAAFEALTGCAVIVNTSFNVRGEPIVCTPKDAYSCFMRTEMDLLVLEDCILRKADQPAFEDDEDWRTRYELD
jgi:carbamoyltransferase